MNPVYFGIITAVITLITVVLAIFAANWLNQHTMEKLMEKQTQLLESRVENLRVEMRGEFKTVETRLNNIDHRLGQVETRVVKIDEALFKPVLSRTGD